MLSPRYREIVGGLALLVGSGAYLYGALQYRLGIATKMGPGYFPMLLGICGLIVAMMITIRGLSMAVDTPRGEYDDDSVSIRPLIAVSLSVIAFAAAIHSLGLLAAVVASVVTAAAGDRQSTIKGTIILAASLALGCWFVFAYMLELNIPVLAGVLE